MTTLWHITPEWQGQTVAVLGCGPSLTAAAVKRLRADRVIAVNHAHRLAPQADMLVAMDGRWPQEYRDFPGIRVTGIEDDTLDARYIGPRWERVGPLEIRNSGLTAIRVAAALGAARILLLGFEPETVQRFTPADDEGVSWRQDPYRGVAQGLRNIVAELTAAGVAVEFIVRPVPKESADG